MDKPVYIVHWAHMGLLSRPHMGPLWACSYGLVRMGPIRVLYGLAHMENSYTSLTRSIWECYLGHPWVHYWRVYMRLSALDPYWYYMGVPIWA